MLRILKVGNVIYENTEEKILEPAAFDEQGNPTQFQERWIIPKDPVELAKLLKDTLIWLADRRVKQVLDSYEYYSLADVRGYAQDKNDPEAQALLNWYYAYDDAVWAFIESNFAPIINGTQQTTVDQLLQNYSDLKAVEEQIYQQSLQNNPLPGETL